MELDTIIQGDALTVLKTLPDESVNTVITSPPYWNLRDYGTAQWIGGDPDCDHIEKTNVQGNKKDPYFENVKFQYKSVCHKCGAIRVDQQIGLESSVEEYITKLCDIFDEVKRVLRTDGTCWVNIGDTYNHSNKGNHNGSTGTIGKPRYSGDFTETLVKHKQKNIPPKSLCLIPERFAIEMVNRGWILRNVIIWHKPNCMPQSVKDRFTVDFEYVYFFVKNEKYWFEQQFEPIKIDSLKRERRGNKDNKYSKDEYFPKGVHANTMSQPRKYRGYEGLEEEAKNRLGRNKRCVWTIQTQPFPEAHFACVDKDTEILTIDGWKRYNEIDWKQHKKVATYNLKKKIIEYQPLSYIKTYNYDGELLKIGNRDLDILTTFNHRNVVKKRIGEETIVLSENLAYSDKIRVMAPVSYPENNGIGKTLAELIGWIIAEGHYRKDGYIEIYQNEGKKSERIEYLLKRLEIPYTKHTRKCQNIENTFYLKKSPLTNWIRDNVPNKELNKFLASLPQNEIKRLFEGLINGDGHTRKDDGRISFIQKNKETKDWFQILALRLGYHSMQEGKSVYLTKRTHIGIRNTNGNGKAIQKIRYKGIIWCPKTPNGTWVARRNGRIFITGNTYPEKLIMPMIEAGCPRGGIVLDPFMGSGTTALVAKKLGRHYIGIELNPEYIEMANRRIKAIPEPLPLKEQISDNE